MSRNASGGVHVNFGKPIFFGEGASGSVLVNFLDAGSIGSNSRDCVSLNVQNTRGMASKAVGGVHANLLYADEIGEKSEESVLANYGFPCMVAGEAFGGVYFNRNYAFGRTKEELKKQKARKPTTEDVVRSLLVREPYFKPEKEARLSALFECLEERLAGAEIDRAATGRKHFFYLGDPETAINLVAEYDWKKFKKDVEAIALQIKEAAA